ncbi:MAG: peptide chain release factor N(5)-glutamine methyltransferase [Actinomycetota bacterium]
MAMSDDTITWRAMLAETAQVVADRTAALWLCQRASGYDAEEFMGELDNPVTSRAAAHLHDMVRRFLGGEPLQYVLGRWAFRRLDIMVDARVLIPRPETEMLVDLVLDEVSQKPGATIVDLGTGSGAIGLAVLDELPLSHSTVWMTDVSRDALDVASANVAGLGRPGIGARLAHGSWFDALPVELKEAVDVVVANPPYVGDDDPDLEERVREWEPSLALFAGPDGLRDIVTIVSGCNHWLRPGGLLLIEFGSRQGDEVRELATDAGLCDVEILQDLAGLDRVLRARASR